MDLVARKGVPPLPRSGRKQSGHRPSASAQLCLWTAVGMLIVAVGGWLSNQLFGTAGNLPALGLLALGYLLLAMQQTASDWLAGRAANRRHGGSKGVSLAAGYLSHAEALPPRGCRQMRFAHVRAARVRPVASL